MFLIRRFEERVGQGVHARKNRRVFAPCDRRRSCQRRLLAPCGRTTTFSPTTAATVTRSPRHRPEPVMAELYGRATGSSRGLGGSMHFASREHHFWGGHAIVGGHFPIAAAWRSPTSTPAAIGSSSHFRRRLGEHRCLPRSDELGRRLEASGHLHRVNNLYGMGTAIERSSAVTEIYKRGRRTTCPASALTVTTSSKCEAEVREAGRMPGRRRPVPP